MMGIPACFVVAPVMLLLQQWWMGLAMFLGGYALQFIGHLIEASASGEAVLLRRALSRSLEAAWSLVRRIRLARRLAASRRTHRRQARPQRSV